ncbi:MAG: sulfite dehydrogenase, partial [Thermus sp.]
DEAGHTQPTREEFFRKWSRNNRYHYNAIQAWRVLKDGRVVNGDRPLPGSAQGPAGGCDGEVFDV